MAVQTNAHSPVDGNNDQSAWPRLTLEFFDNPIKRQTNIFKLRKSLVPSTKYLCRERTPVESLFMKSFPECLAFVI